MCIEGEAGRLAVGAESVVWAIVLADDTIEVHGELLADLAREFWNGRGLPGSETLRVAKVATLIGGLSAVEVAEEVQLFGWVVLVDVCVLEGRVLATGGERGAYDDHTERLT